MKYEAGEHGRGVSPDSMLLTNKGYIRIGDHIGKRVSIWNGIEYKSTKIHKSPITTSMYSVLFDNGMRVDGAGGNLYTIQNGSETHQKRLHELIIGDMMGTLPLEIIAVNNAIKMDRPYIKGFDAGKSQTGNDFIVPGVLHDVDSRVKWLAGFIDVTGIQTKRNGNPQIRLRTGDRNLLVNVFRLIQTMGIGTSVDDKPWYGASCLTLSPMTIWKLKNLGIGKSSLIIGSGFIQKPDEDPPVKVAMVRNHGIFGHSFGDHTCFFEGNGVINGVMVGF